MKPISSRSSSHPKKTKNPYGSLNCEDQSVEVSLMSSISSMVDKDDSSPSGSPPCIDEIYFNAYSTDIPYIFSTHVENQKMYSSRHRVSFKTILHGDVDSPKPQSSSLKSRSLSPRRRNRAKQEIKKMLIKHSPSDEISAVNLELNKCNMEIKALEHDQAVLSSKLDMSDGKINKINPQNRTLSIWDIDEVLSYRPSSSVNVASNRKKNWFRRKYTKGIKKKHSPYKQEITISPRNNDANEITDKYRRQLQKKRGNQFVIFFEDPTVQNKLCSSCNVKSDRLSKLQKIKSDSLGKSLKDENNYGSTNIDDARHAVITSSNEASSFFLSRDNGTANWHGRFPSKLWDRAKRENMKVSSIRYLVVGPGGSYFTQFSTGECWWGISQLDTDFHKYMNSLEVCRVAFGTFANYIYVGEASTIHTSWVIIGKDGRCVWKNIPSGLHNLLLSRTSNDAAPCEVSLGKGDSYFIKFLDGVTNYCLPAGLASTYEQIESMGGEIRNVSFNSQSYDYIIRYEQKKNSTSK